MPSRRVDRTASLILIVAATVWLACRPYFGLRHDGTLYFGQVLSHGLVPALGLDPFFAAGSQDRFSFYSPVVGWLYAHFGVAATHQALLLLCVSASATAGWRLLLRWMQPRMAAIGMLALASLSPYYGSMLVFSYGEAFLTARSLAEPLSLWAIVLLLDRRWLLAMGLLLSALIMHPLMAAPAMFTMMGFAVLGHPRWLALPLACLAAALGLAWAGVPPWDGLLRPFDPYWFALVEQANPSSLLTNWRMQDLMLASVDASLLLVAWAATPKASPERRWLAALLATGALLLGIELVGADGLHLRLVTAVQLWRVLWLWHVTAIALLPWLIWRHWQSAHPAGRLLAACLAGAAYAAHAVMADAGWAYLTGAALSAALVRWPLAADGKGMRLALLLLLMGIALLWIAHLADIRDLARMSTPDAPLPPLFTEWLTDPVTLTLLATGCVLLLRHRATALPIGIAVACTALVAAVLNWDQRDRLARAIESHALQPHPFQAHIAPDRSVYWPDELPAVWGWLQRASHYSEQQNAGTLFNFGTAQLMGVRRDAYRRIENAAHSCLAGAEFARDAGARAECASPREDLVRELCTQAEHPDYLIFRRRISKRVTPLDTWSPDGDASSTDRFHLYACEQFTAG